MQSDVNKPAHTAKMAIFHHAWTSKFKGFAQGLNRNPDQCASNASEKQLLNFFLLSYMSC